MIAGPCPACGDDQFHAIADALAIDDLDRAIALGLLDIDIADTVDGIGSTCAVCAQVFVRIGNARTARLAALAARERYRTREVRLTARAEARARKRSGIAASARTAATPALPPAAAAALSRALAKAASRH